VSRESFERWMGVLKQVQLANADRFSLSPAVLDNAAKHCQSAPEVRLHRETVFELRANYHLLTNVVGELLDLDPLKMTAVDVISAMLERAHADKADAPVEGEWRCVCKRGTLVHSPYETQCRFCAQLRPPVGEWTCACLSGTRTHPSWLNTCGDCAVNRPGGAT
jgi:hypothetical protein